LAGERAHYELAAGRDVRLLITAIENFASQGGMLPEQVWDAPDLPVAGMYLGRPAGSAMPLMWAHAEYIKLLRSVNDGAIFDLIPIVAARYHGQQGRKDLEIWKSTRQVRAMAAGAVLRVVSAGAFRLRWSLDGVAAGQSLQESASTASGLGPEFVDIPTRAGQASTLRFSFQEHDAGGGPLPTDIMHEVQVKVGL
jgi:glucoamylase